MDWNKTRKVRVNPFKEEPTIELRVFGPYASRTTDMCVHVQFAVNKGSDDMITVVGTKSYLAELQERLGSTPARLLNFQKAVHAKHSGLLLVAEPDNQADVERMEQLLRGVKANISTSRVIA